MSQSPTDPPRSGPPAPRLDALDRGIIALFRAEPQIGVLAASRRLQVARGTVQARLDRMARNGIITGWGPEVSPEALGYVVTAFVTMEIVQHSGRRGLIGRLTAIPELLECWTITGSGDLWCRVVAHSNADLQRVLDKIGTDPDVVRTVTQIGLADPIPFRTGPLIEVP